MCISSCHSGLVQCCKWYHGKDHEFRSNKEMYAYITGTVISIILGIGMGYLSARSSKSLGGGIALGIIGCCICGVPLNILNECFRYCKVYQFCIDKCNKPSSRPLLPAINPLSYGSQTTVTITPFEVVQGDASV